MRPFSLVTAAALLSASLVAHADTFDFDYEGTYAGAVGSFVADPVSGLITSANGYFDIYITGSSSATVFPILGLLPPSYNDNYVTQVNCYYDPAYQCYSFDYLGVGFILANGGQAILYALGTPGLTALDFSAPGIPYLGFSIGPALIEPTSSSPTDVTPEPSAIALLSTGLLGAATLLRRRSG